MPFTDIKDLTAEQKYDEIASFIPNMKRAAKGSSDIKYMRTIAKGKGKATEAVVSGISIIESITNSDVEIKHLIICTDEIFTERAQRCIFEASKKSERILAVSQATYALIGAKKNSNGIAALIELEFKKIEDIVPEGISIVLDALELPGNVGTIMRTAESAGFKSVIITNPKVRLNNSTLLAASRGAFAKLDIVVDSVDNISKWAKSNDVNIYLADTRAKNIHTNMDLSSKVCFVLGCERYGIDEKWYEKEHELLKIPMLGDCDSLNVGVAGSILIYETLRQQSK